MILPSKYARSIDRHHGITDICKSCYFNIRNIYRIGKLLSIEHTKILVDGFLTSRLGNCNSLLYGFPFPYITACVQNCTARLILGGHN